MTAETREFVLAAGPDPLQPVTAAAPDGLSWSAGRPAGTLKRTWLDTFDWRLHQAGLTLEQVVSGDEAELRLTGPDGAPVAGAHLAAGDVPAWPLLAGELPAGPLRQALRKVTGVRALCVVARAVSTRTELSALDGEAKTVARLGAEQAELRFPARAQVPARVKLTAVRGYEPQAARLGDAIARLPGVTEGHQPALPLALAAAQVRPGETPSKAAAVPLRPDAPAAAGLAALLTALLEVIEANVPGTIRDIDTEFLHDLRVAVRWTRSALKLCGDALPGDLAARFAPEFRWLGDLTTPTRDLDVFLLDYPAMARRLAAAQPGDLEPFREQLERSREQAFGELKAGLTSARFTRLRETWRQALAQLQQQAGPEPTVARLADDKIARAQRRALKAGQKISDASPPEDLHNLRKRCKELRYLVEMFGSLHDPAHKWQAVRELKRLQDCLGDYQDSQVQRGEIAGFAEAMMRERSAPAQTLLALGEISAGLAARQHEEREKFSRRFADFAGPQSQDRLTALASTSARPPAAGGA